MRFAAMPFCVRALHLSSPRRWIDWHALSRIAGPIIGEPRAELDRRLPHGGALLVAALTSIRCRKRDLRRRRGIDARRLAGDVRQRRRRNAEGHMICERKCREALRERAVDVSHDNPHTETKMVLDTFGAPEQTPDRAAGSHRIISEAAGRTLRSRARISQKNYRLSRT